MKAPKHLVALAVSNEASMPVSAIIKENGVQVKKQAGRHQTRPHSATCLKALQQERDSAV